MDIHSITYTTWEGEEENAYAYLMADGDLACFSEHGSRTSDCAPIAILLFAAQVDGGCEDSREGLDGCMSLVVNDNPEVTYSILDSQHVYGDDFNPLDWFTEEQIEDARRVYAVAYCGATPSF